MGARGRLTTGLLILEALIALEILIVAAILPAVQRDLHGLQLYGWNYAALTLASFGAVPIAGRLTDRLGPRKVLGAAIAIYGLGLAMAATAPTMLVLVIARFVQGIGGGGLYVVSLATVAKTYPERIRPRVMALLASMWILPGLLGPPVGALLAETVGWRYAFVAPLPLIALALVLVMPALRAVRVSEKQESRLPVVASLVLMVGAGSLLAGLTDLSVWSIPLVVVGAAVTIPALRRVVPAGTLTARRGVPAASAAAFLASAAFFATDGFLTLMLTETRGLSIGAASLVLTASSLAWAAGSWWQSRVIVRIGARRITAFGATLIATGSAVVAVGLLDVPVFIPYIGWAIGAAGMGIVFPTIPLAVMAEVEEGREAGELSSTILMDYLGVGIGAGLGGASIALADAGTISIEAGLAGAFAIGIVAAVLLALVARRLPDARTS
jgi:MFS family permease